MYLTQYQTKSKSPDMVEAISPYENVVANKKFKRLNLPNISDEGPEESIKTLKESGSDAIIPSSTRYIHSPRVFNNLKNTIKVSKMNIVNKEEINKKKSETVRNTCKSVPM